MITNPFGLTLDYLDAEDWTLRLGEADFRSLLGRGILKPIPQPELLDGRVYLKRHGPGEQKEFYLWVEGDVIRLEPVSGVGNCLLRSNANGFYSLDPGALSSTLRALNAFDPPTNADPLIPGFQSFGSRKIGQATTIRWFATKAPQTLSDPAIAKAFHSSIPDKEVWLAMAERIPPAAETLFPRVKRVVPLALPTAADAWRLPLSIFCKKEYGIEFHEAYAALDVEYKLLVSDNEQEIYLLGFPFPCKSGSDLHRLLVGLARLGGRAIERTVFIENYMKKQNSSLDEGYRQLRERLPKVIKEPGRLAEAQSLFAAKQSPDGFVQSPFAPTECLIYS